MNGPQRRRLDREILSLRVALVGELPPQRRALVAAELEDLRLARLGVLTNRTRARLAHIGIGPRSSQVLHRGPECWGEVTRVHLS